VNKPTPEQVDAAGPRTVELLARLEAAVDEHMAAHAALPLSDRRCDVFTAIVRMLVARVEGHGLDRLRILQVLADELGVETITANSKSVGHA